MTLKYTGMISWPGMGNARVRSGVSMHTGAILRQQENKLTGMSTDRLAPPTHPPSTTVLQTD